MRVGSVCFIVLMFATAIFAQKGKSWTAWSKKDVEKTLNDSAWGQTQIEGGSSQPQSSDSAITQVAAPRSADRQITRTGESGEAKPSTVVKYHVRFLSAKPVRAAFARMVLLSKSQPDENLTTQLQGFVDRDMADYIVVSVGIEVENEKMAAPLMRAFTAATTEALQKNVYLERKDGKKLYLMEYRAPIEDGLGAKFVFPRNLEGQPFLSESDSVRFVAQMNEKMKVNTRYKLSDMQYEGKLEY
jgi:hypothetical protein